MADHTLQIFGDIQKYDMDGESLIVSGILSTPDKDKQGEIVTPDAMRKALGEYLLNGTCREMHQPIAAGKPLSAFVDDEGRTHVTVKVVDKGTIAKVKEGVLKGFSIGGQALKKVGNKITELFLKDASLVDVPANPQCVFDVVKFDQPGDRCNDPECKNHTEGATSKCASCMSKGDDAKPLPMEKCGCGGKMKKGMKKCSKCMEKSASSEELDNPHDKSMKKMLCKAWNLASEISDEDFEKELAKRLTAPTNPLDAKIEKLEATLAKTDLAMQSLVKSAEAANKRAEEGQRDAIIKRLQRDGRVIMKNQTTAFPLNELQKMDLSTLEVLSFNAPQLPTQAAHVYKGDGTGLRNFLDSAGKPLAGSAAVEAALEVNYGTLEQMQQRFSPNN